MKSRCGDKSYSFAHAEILDSLEAVEQIQDAFFFNGFSKYRLPDMRISLSIFYIGEDTIEYCSGK